MGLWRSLAGSICIQVTSASPLDAISVLSQNNIAVHNVTMIDDLSFTCVIARGDYKSIKQILQRRGDRVQICRKNGLYWSLQRLIKRPVLTIGVLFLLAFSLYLPTRVFFVQIEGNQQVSDTTILDASELSGIRFGASRRAVRSEKIKNQLLERIPQLQWVGVNTYGCVAVITVKERTDSETTDNKHTVSSIIADRDGIIEEITVTSGNALCRVGQAVKKGQIMVSGYTDCGLIIKAESSQAEIMARTMRELNVKTPLNYSVRTQIDNYQTKFSILIGKKLINFSQDSGILHNSCVKIREIKQLTLPGGFKLPVALIIERTACCELHDQSEDSFVNYDWVDNYACAYLKENMISGRILNHSYTSAVANGTNHYSGIFYCSEMIGRNKLEENYTCNE